MSNLFDDDDLIFNYSSEQGLEDGFLVEPFPERYPKLYLTRTLFSEIEAVSDGRTFEQKAIPLIMDVVMEARRRVEESRNSGKPVDTLIILEGTVAGTVWATPNDAGGLTIMMPEDY